MENPQPFSRPFVEGTLPSHCVESGYFQSNLVSTYRVGVTSYAKTNFLGDVGTDTFFYRGGTFDCSYRQDDDMTGSSDHLVSDDVYVDGSGGMRGAQTLPVTGRLNRVSQMLA